MCICCFFNSYKQYEIRKGIQLRTDRFEHYIDKYKKYFISKFEENLQYELCKEYADNEILVEILKDIDQSEINNFFNELRDIYIFWIDSKPAKALTKFKNLVNKYNIFEIKENLEGRVLFRGRISDTFLSHWDMFHIPFNKRYLIGNQRYSLVGQPILYLATSPYCVVKELNSINNIKISTVVRQAKNKKDNIILFNNSNNINKFIKKEKQDIIGNMIIDNDRLDKKEIEKFLFQFILSICCSFSVKNSNKNCNFIEEYVLPQLLAQIAKEKKFDGIIFDSIQCLDEKHLCDDNNMYQKLCKNICIFTKYDSRKADDVTYVYDKKLYKKLSIHTPISYNEIELNDGFHDISKSTEINDKISSNFDSELNEISGKQLQEISEYLLLYQSLNEEKINKISNKNKKLFEDSIKLHKIAIRNILLDILDDLIKQRG